MSRTLSIRHVPDHVTERLERLANRAGLPLSTFALRELSEAPRRADNADLLQALPSAVWERAGLRLFCSGGSKRPPGQPGELVAFPRNRIGS